MPQKFTHVLTRKHTIEFCRYVEISLCERKSIIFKVISYNKNRKLKQKTNKAH